VSGAAGAALPPSVWKGSAFPGRYYLYVEALPRRSQTGGIASWNQESKPERQSLSARKAAKPQIPLSGKAADIGKR
jgi:hypothetical protein